MEQLVAIAVFLGVLFLFLGSGVWVGLSLMGVAYIGIEFIAGRAAGGGMINTIWGASSSWTLTALPLFVWMGEILFRTRLSEDMFKGLSPLDGAIARRIGTHQYCGLYGLRCCFRFFCSDAYDCGKNVYP